ncbi:MAG: YajQ family cyclic di-GMP-binding protein [Steroidobacteraceae bacterium]
MPSFDVVSEINGHELSNAVDQANRELAQRFDFRDSGAGYELDPKACSILMKAKVVFQLRQMLEILNLKLAKRGIALSCLEVKDPESNVAEARQTVILRHGVDADCGRKICKLIKDSKLKVQAGIHGEKVRVTGKQRDDLQQAIALLRRQEFDRPLQYENFRD